MQGALLTLTFRAILFRITIYESFRAFETSEAGVQDHRYNKLAFQVIEYDVPTCILLMKNIYVTFFTDRVVATFNRLIAHDGLPIAIR
jgi:hypothetical protein